MSSHGQRPDLDGQVRVLKARAPGAEAYSDIGSGLNFERTEVARRRARQEGLQDLRDVRGQARLLATLCRGLRLCGQPFAVSADASRRQMRDEYLYTGGTPGAVRAGRTDAASAPNLDAYTKVRV